MAVVPGTVPLCPQVLVVSRDAMLLQTRQLILGSFFHTEGAGRMKEVEALISSRRYHLIVLLLHAKRAGAPGNHENGDGAEASPQDSDSCSGWDSSHRAGGRRNDERGRAASSAEENGRDAGRGHPREDQSGRGLRKL